MVAFSDPQWLQGAFSTLVCLFDRVGMRTNVRKTVGMVFCPCRAEGTQSEVEYGQQMTGEGPSYRERQKGRVKYKECGEYMSLGSMTGHMRTQNGQAAEERRSWASLTLGEELQTYRTAIPTAGGPWSCLVEECSGQAAKRTAMQVHFMHRHVQDTVVILEEGTPPPPTVLSMQHAVPWECSEQKVPCHHPVCQGGGAEDKASSGRGTAGDLGEGLSGL